MGSFTKIERILGTSSDTANTDSTSTTDSLFGNIKGVLARLATLVTNTDKFQFDANGNHYVTQGTALSSSIDSIDVNKMSKGAVTTLTFSGSGDSAEIDCSGFNSVCLVIVGSITVSVKGSAITGGTKYACQDGATAMSSAITTGGCVFWRGIPEYIAINSNGAGTVYVQPMNV